jgi:hypothetical protein
VAHPAADLQAADLRVVVLRVVVLRVVVRPEAVHPEAVHPAAVLRVADLRVVIHPAAVLPVVARPVAILQAVVRQVALACPVVRQVVLRVVRVVAFPDSRFPASVARQWEVLMVTEMLTVTVMARAVAIPIAAGLACLAVSAAWAEPGNVVTVARLARVRLPTRPGAQVVKVLPAALVNILVKPMRSAPRVSAKSWTNL